MRRCCGRSSCPLAFRNPRDAILSPRSAWGIQNLVPWARSYIAAQRALIRLRRNFPRTVPVFLENVGADTFLSIEDCLGSQMPALSSVMIRKEESPRDVERIPLELRETVNDLEVLYPMLRDAVSSAIASTPDSSFDAIDVRLAELYRRLGSPRRPAADLAIAATALAHGAVLVTGNRDDYEDVPGLQILASG